MPKSKFAFKRKEGTPAATPSRTIASSSARSLDYASQQTVSAPTPSSDLSLHDHEGCYLDLSTIQLVKKSELVATIENIDRCIVNLLSKPSSTNSVTFSAVHISNVSNSIIILPALRGSIIAHKMRRCVLAVACHQVGLYVSILQSSS